MAEIETISSYQPKHFSEAEIQALLEERRQSLEAELGLPSQERAQFEKPIEHPFTRAEREHTTILFGGLTWKHERLIQAALSGLGYRMEMLSTPNVDAFQLGKEFGNNGQCNPTYFTVGNLVQHLQQLEKNGLSRDEILRRYVYITAGACGPCRFGMYEAEYRLALRNSGFDGFRVILFQQKGGFNQSDADAGIEMNVDFFLALLNAIVIGDLINDVAYQIRPFELFPGTTDSVLAECIEDLSAVFRARQANRGSQNNGGKMADVLRRFPKARDRLRYVSRWHEQLTGDEFIQAVARCYERFANIEVDRFRVRPVVKITGEFWAQTTEGDGNFNMFTFLEREGAQVLVEPIGTWLMYMLHQAKQKARDRQGIRANASEGKRLKIFSGVLESMEDRIRSKQRLAVLSLGESLFEREWERLRHALHDLPHALTNQYHLQRIAHPYYNSRASGGEGHLEVAKNIYYSSKALCHMVLSVKPFGCMPSSQSDGVQSAVVNHFKDIIYLPIETSGEGEVNAHSRVQMALGEARKKAAEEFERVCGETRHGLQAIRDFVAANSALRRVGTIIPKSKDTVGVAANFVRHVDSLMS